jgi:DNA-binding CsgD family transcriptional regulator
VPDMTPDKTYVLICDCQGRLAWSSDKELRTKIGTFVWKTLLQADVEEARLAFARTASLSEFQTIEVRDRGSQQIRMWLWPMNPPESAVCILCQAIPRELAKLTAREKDCLGLLAQGMSTKLIASELDIGLSTVHTHLKHMRKKLDLPRFEALISFAARYCHPGSDED